MTYVRPDGRRTRETAIPIIVIIFIIILIIIPTVPVADNRLDSSELVLLISFF